MKPSNYLSKYYSWTKTPATSPTYNYSSSTNQIKTSRKRRPSSPEKILDWPYYDLQNDENISDVSSMRLVCPLKDDDAATEDDTASSTLDVSFLEESDSIDALPTTPNFDESNGREQQTPETLFSPPKHSAPSVAERRTTLATALPIKQPTEHSKSLKLHPDFTHKDHNNQCKRPRRMYGFHQNPHQRWQHYCDTGAHELLHILQLQKKQDEKQQQTLISSSPINMIPSVETSSMMNTSMTNDPQKGILSVAYSDVNTSIKNKEESSKVDKDEEECTVVLYQPMPVITSSPSNKTASPIPPIECKDANDIENSDSDTVVYFYCMEGSSRVPFSHTIHNHASLPAYSPPSLYDSKTRHSPMKYDKPDVPPRQHKHQPQQQSPFKSLKLPTKAHKQHQSMQQGRDYRYHVNNTPMNSPDAIDKDKYSLSTSFSKTSTSSFFSRLWTFPSYQNTAADDYPNTSK